MVKITEDKIIHFFFPNRFIIFIIKFSVHRIVAADKFGAVKAADVTKNFFTEVCAILLRNRI